MSTVETLEYTYTDELKQAIEIAQSIAREYSNARFTPAHLLKAVLHKDVGLIPFLDAHEKDYHYMREWADVRIEEAPKSGKLDGNPVGDEKVSAILDEADIVRLKLNKNNIDPLCVLAALCTPGVAFTYEQMKSFPVTQKEIMEVSVAEISIHEAVTAGKNSGDGAEKSVKTNALQKYCVDKTAIAREGKLDPIIGREGEIRMIAEILGRRSKPNVIIAGEPGVGKTALVDGFAQNIVNKLVPSNLQNAVLFELDFGSLVAGASYKGEVEDRLKNIVKEIKQFDKAILFIDEIHSLLDNAGAAAGSANILKPELARGELTVIGATTVDEYRQFIEPDDAFSRRFEMVKVEEPDEATASKMINIVLPFYEKHHGITLAVDAVPESVRLAKRYLKERSLPDSAIDLVDRTMSALRMMSETSVGELEKLSQALENLSKDMEKSNEEEKFKELKWFNSQLEQKLSPVLLGFLQDDTQVDQLTSSTQLSEYLKRTIIDLQKFAANKKDRIEKSDIASVVAKKTGIPIGKVQSSEKERLLNMEEALKKRVVGQDHALKIISEAVLESRSGLLKGGQPIGSFFFLGPTGTGKTELAKSLAEFLFADENALLRFDMSEFKEEHSVALLYGAPPGYVGYQEGGLLVNGIRQRPYSVVLFDEIEKAHKSVFDLFLQILDEGKLHDRLGKEGDFSNAIVLFTSNIGSQVVVDKFNKGEVPKTSELMEIMGQFFRPEFLGRLTEIVPFAPISEGLALNIFNIHLKDLVKILEKQGIELDISPEAKESLAKSGFNPKYGARPLKGVIRNQLRKPISRMIISGQVTKGNVIKADIDDKGELKWDIQKKD